MTNKEILQKALEKASSNSKFKFLMPSIVDNYTIYFTIFNHEFAKSFWGDKPIKIDEVYNADKEEEGIERIGYKSDEPWYDYTQTWTLEFPAWQLHLREMVLEENPLQYLEKFI